MQTKANMNSTSARLQTNTRQNKDRHRLTNTKTTQVAVVKVLPGFCALAFFPAAYPSPIPNDSR